MRTRRTRRAAVGLAVVATALGVVTGCSRTTFTDGARPGQVELGGGGTIDEPAHHAVVHLPLGPLTIQVGAPVRDLTGVPDAERAADGASWVPIAWTLGGNGADFGNNFAAFQFQVTLVADGRRYGLQAGQASGSDEAASKYTPVVKEKALDVVVQGNGTHLSAEVEYDGVTQTVDFDSGRIRSGVAAALYAKGAPHTALTKQDCPVLSAADARGFRASNGTSCTIGAVQTEPYVGGVGWVASTAQTWTLVPLDFQLIELYSNTDNGQYSNFDIQRVAVTVDGAEPTTELLRYRDYTRIDALRSGVFVFRTSSTPKSLHFTITYRTEDEYHPGRFHTFSGDRTYPLS